MKKAIEACNRRNEIGAQHLWPLTSGRFVFRAASKASRYLNFLSILSYSIKFAYNRNDTKEMKEMKSIRKRVQVFKVYSIFVMPFSSEDTRHYSLTLRLEATTKSEAAALDDCPRMKYLKLEAVTLRPYLCWVVDTRILINEYYSQTQHRSKIQCNDHWNASTEVFFHILPFASRSRLCF